MIYFLRQLKISLPKLYLKLALLKSCTTIVIWGHSPADLHKRTVSVISHSGYLERCRLLFRKLGIMTVVSQYVYNTLWLLKDNVNNFVRKYIITVRGLQKIWTFWSVEILLPKKLTPILLWTFKTHFTAEVRELNIVKFKRWWRTILDW